MEYIGYFWDAQSKESLAFILTISGDVFWPAAGKQINKEINKEIKKSIKK